jgi:hypothetical protein
MAEENILLRVGIDQNQIKQSEQSIVSARTEIDRLKAANKQLEDQGQKNSVQFVRNQTDIKDLSITVRENERVLQANAKMSRSAGGSIAELRESVKTLQAEYVNLSAEERENEKVGGQLQKQIKAQNDELKNLEKQIGITGRNVGNYKDEVKAALAESGLFNKAQAALAAGQQAVASAQKIATISTKSFGAALVATGIGAILVLLGSLVTFLTQTQRGMDLVAQATSAVGTFVGKVTDSFSKLGEQLIKAVIPTFTSLADIIGGILTLDFDQVRKGIDGVSAAVSGIEPINLLEVGKNALQASKDAVILTKQLQDVTRAEKNLDLQRAQSRQNIERLKLIAEDQTKSTEERAKAAEEALNLELGLEQKAIKLQEERIRILAAQNDLTNSTDEDNNRLIDAQIQLANLQQESATKQIELNNKLNALRKEGATESIKDTKELAKETDKVIINQNKVFQDQLKQRAKDTEIEIRNTINKLKKEFADGQITPEEFSNQLAQIEAVAIQTRRTAFELQLADTVANSQLEADTKLAIEADLQEKLRQLDDEEINASVKVQQEKLNAAKKSSEEQVKLAQDRANAEKAALDSVLSAALNVFGQQSAAGKIAASFQAVIDTFRGANLALATIPPPFGQIIAASTVASGLANVAKINSKSAPKFAEGGGIEIAGASHAGGGVDVALGGQTVANVEGGEGLFVMKKDAFQSLKALSNYNQMFGGNSWFGGGKKFLADGGAISRGSSPTIDRRLLQDTQASLSSAMQSINVVTRVTDIDRVSNEMKLVEMQGDLR